jgi:hypothetical protein
MSTDATNLPVKSSNGLAVERTDLAQVRTRPAADGTEWARTITRQVAERTMNGNPSHIAFANQLALIIYNLFEAIREKFGAEGPIRALGHD